MCIGEAGGRWRKKKRERGKRLLRSDRNKTERTYLLYVAHTGERTCARVRYTCMSLFPPLRVRLHPCVKFLRGILPSPSPPTTSFLPLIYTRPNRDQAAPPNSVRLVFGRSNFDGGATTYTIFDIFEPRGCAGQVLISSRPEQRDQAIPIPPLFPSCAFRVGEEADMKHTCTHTYAQMNHHCRMDAVLYRASCRGLRYHMVVMSDKRTAASSETMV